MIIKTMKEYMTEDMSIRELRKLKELTPVKDYLFTHMTEDTLERKLSYYRPVTCDIAAGLERVTGLFAEGRQVIYDVYGPEEIAREPDKQEVKLLYLPAEKEIVCDGKKRLEKRPYVLFCPGGGYFRQWVMVEGYPTASAYNKLGYPVFLLIYRTVQTGHTAQTGLLPKPMEDAAAAVRFIEQYAKEFGVESRYAMGGFSAGGHLAAAFGTKTLGYARYDVKKPEALFLIYPGISMECFYQRLQNAKNDTGREYLTRACGEEITWERIKKYSIEYQVDASYPPTYLLHNQDDDTVPIASSYAMEKALKHNQIPYQTHFPKTGNHACGVAHGLDAEGWVAETIHFWRAYMPIISNCS